MFEVNNQRPISTVSKDEETRKPICILDTGCKEKNSQISDLLKPLEVRFLENVKMQYFKLIYSDRLDICRKIMAVYALMVNLHHKENFLKQRTADVLAFYMAMGYSQETKAVVVEALETNFKNLNQINAELTRKMFLIRDPFNSQKRSLNPELQQLRDFFLNTESETVSCNIRFEKRKQAVGEMKIVGENAQ